MSYSIYKCEFKEVIHLMVASKEYIDYRLESNPKKSDSEIYLQKDKPAGYYDFKAEPYIESVHKSIKFESLIYQDTIEVDISIFNEQLRNFLLEKIIFFNAKIDDNYFSNLYLTRKLFINDASKGKVDLSKYKNLEEISILQWNKNIIFEGDNSINKHLIVWEYKPKSKRLHDLLQKMENVETLWFGPTNIESLDGIEQLKNLKSLELNYGRNLKSVKALNDNKKLESILLNKCNKIEDLKELTPRANLEINVTNIPG